MKANDAKRLKELESRERPAEEAAGRGRARQGDAQGAGGGKLLTPNRRRAAVQRLQAAVRGLRTQSVCAWSASTAPPSASAPPTPSDDEEALRAFLRAFSKERPRWGWRRAAKALRREGWRVNNKRVQRLWREEGLKVPYRKRKKPLRGIGTRVGAM